LGAFGCIPLGLILPMLFYNLTFKPSKLSLVFLANTSIVDLVVVSSVLIIGGGALSSVRQILLDLKMYDS
jgi:hypothetical protein